ncbi:CRISPR type III-associated RAMP protein Csm3 [Lachnospiraceae bacterium]|jgi:CRISPR type III-A/MTUBE-associated RAMP protein Csm3|nr:CRISPR type III-associated RAMP protein Csm3 [Lachnospiraceae bacterium]
MITKVRISGKIEVLTGMHIGGSSAFSAIGAVDSPVVRDVRSRLPMIPGSSLKGKMRALLAKKYNTAVVEPDNDAPCLIDLFGSAKKENIRCSRILFSDMIMSNWDELKQQGLTSSTEVKFENSIKRTTAVANPRQIERVIRGAEFPLDLIYEMDTEEKMKMDFEIIRDGLRLLEYDYLGGNGSRGYGKVRFKELELEVLIGDISEEILNECQGLLNEV